MTMKCVNNSEMKKKKGTVIKFPGCKVTVTLTGWLWRDHNKPINVAGILCTTWAVLYQPALNHLQ